MRLLDGFSPARWWGMVLKEFLQLRRDRLTFAMIIAIPLAQLTLFGFAINTDPKQMPMAIISADESDITRTLVAALKCTGYFNIIGRLPDEEAGRRALAQGKVLFVLTIPADFTRSLLRNEHPSLLLEADATDPTATGMALASVTGVARSVTVKDLTGPLAYLAEREPPFRILVHRLYNPEGINQYTGGGGTGKEAGGPAHGGHPAPQQLSAVQQAQRSQAPSLLAHGAQPRQYHATAFAAGFLG